MKKPLVTGQLISEQHKEDFSNSESELSINAAKWVGELSKGHKEHGFTFNI